MSVLQLVPALPPPAEGVGAYALALAGALAGRHAVASRFLVGRPGARVEVGPAFPAEAVAARSADALAAALAAAEAETVLLHYVNYGYQERGCPRWLVEGLERWLAARPGSRLVTIFHEVHASGPPWRSSFWLRPLQRSLAARLARASAALTTSLDLYAEILAGWSRVPPTVLPVFSTVGEPEAVPPIEDRASRLVVFGGRGARERAFGPLSRQLATACEQLEIEEVWDVGPTLPALPSRVGRAGVLARGELPAAEVSRLLAGARAGFVAYPAYFLPKSTIFAAYAAHGVVPVRAWGERELPAGAVLPGAHYWDVASIPEVDGPAIAARAHAWYQDHTLARQAEVFARLLAP